MNKNKVISWFSGGVSSFVATYLVRDKVDEIFYIDIEDQHSDTMRFLHDCEKALNKPIQILKSNYGCVNNVIKQFRFINSPYGAKCTQILKKRVRQEWEAQQNCKLTYVWGYDCNEKHRAERLQQTMTDYNHIFPLLENNLTKEEAHGILENLGIKRPAMYDMGYRNNNCIGCVKGGMGYWNKIRKDFPEVFEKRAKLEREIGASCIKGVYLDELEPNRGRIEDEVMGECGIMCELAYRDK